MRIIEAQVGLPTFNGVLARRGVEEMGACFRSGEALAYFAVNQADGQRSA